MTPHAHFSEGQRPHSQPYFGYPGLAQRTTDLYEGITTCSSISSRGSASRRRSLQAKAGSTEHARLRSPQWTDPGNRRIRTAKEGRTSSRSIDASSSSLPSKLAVGDSASNSREGGVASLSKLHRILESSEHKATRSTRSSTVSSTDGPVRSRQRRRPVEDDIQERRPARLKHSTRRESVSTPIHSQDNSLVSTRSGLSKHSRTSSGSNATIKRASYSDVYIEAARTMGRKNKNRKKKQGSGAVDPVESATSDVFQYMDEDGSQQPPAETGTKQAPEPQSGHSETAKSDSTPRGARSSSEDDFDDYPPHIQSPRADNPGHEVRVHKTERIRSDSGICIEPGSPHESPKSSQLQYSWPVVQAIIEETDSNDDESDSQEGSEDDQEQGSTHDNPFSDQFPTQQLALHRSMAQPTALPEASHEEDAHVRRLREREQELRDHVLQPKPHRDFRFEGGISPTVHMSMPMYDVKAPPIASPPNFHGPAPPPPAPPAGAWAGHAPMSYYSSTYGVTAPYSTDASYSMTAHPVAAPNGIVQAPPVYPNMLAPQFLPQPGGSEPKTTLAGYELLADKLTQLSENEKVGVGDGSVVPMYRKFEQLNHRVLLHLQDEIAELEEELRTADECIAQYTPRRETGQLQPASRRLDARYGNELHYKRTELLGRIFVKLGQYNQALSSYSGMLANLDAASPADIESYRSWLQQHTPIETAESRFLDNKHDLLALSKPRPTVPVPASNAVANRAYYLQQAAVGLPLIAIAPLMAYAIVPGLLGRLFILSLIGSGEVLVVTSTEVMGLLTVREWFVCASM
ncbi:hypothetical protein M011DRAFT_60457 [Sporormia fimetaria CBS 119925]|uniref:DUF6594 domain-containing protein n=1 Tax=Sporormia fimetaria CBS 119925 TaxID=1340428 RepID=A0A6A6V8U9_9PLEO|nr:hypothetical protein M011DRAFT_60457 [Sporormia fimetaria CBS 119925]